MSTSKTYVLNNLKKLIDLNGDSINFEITFKVTAKNPQDVFQLVVADQTTLDNSPELEYKTVQGEISATLTQDKNTFQNHYLILKADKPCECTVEIQKKELPKTVFQPMSQAMEVVEDSNDTYQLIKILLVIGVIVGVSYACFYFYKKHKNESDANMNMDKALPFEMPRVMPYRPSPSLAPSPSLSPSPKFMDSSESSHSGSPKNPFIERLKNLQI